jgi:hypothetical protein
MLKEKIVGNLNKATKGKRELEVSVLRQLLAAILNKEKEKRFKISKEKPELMEKDLEKESQLVDEEIIIDKEVVGKKVFTEKKSKPVYISIGHKISLDKSVEIVKNCMRAPHKMPEPLYLAHRFVKKRMKE